MTSIYDSIRFCTKVDLLQTEKIHKNGKCRFRVACADCAGWSETTLYANVRKFLYASCKPYRPIVWPKYLNIICFWLCLCILSSFCKFWSRPIVWIEIYSSFKPVSHQPYDSRAGTFFDKSQDFARTPQDCRTKSWRRRRRKLIFQHVHFLCDFIAIFGVCTATARLSHGCRTATLRQSHINRAIFYLCLFCEGYTVIVRTSCGCLANALRLVAVCLKTTAERTNIV